MKKFSLIIVVFSVLLLLGCQENSVTDPVSTLEKPGRLVTMETIQLHFVIEDPIGGSSEFVGEVNYTLELVKNSQQINTQSLVSVGIEMNSTLADRLGRTHPEWSSSGRSKESFYVSEEGIYIFEKTYNITNREDVVLVVQYLATTEGIGVPNVWLAQIDR